MIAQHKVYIAIGSNLGDKIQNCINALSLINQRSDCAVIHVSPFYRTSPVGYINQDWFINGAAFIQTQLPHHELLSVLKTIEKQMGRKYQDIQLGPRVIDLDILFYDDLVFSDDNLTIPHPRMHERKFVLKPLLDLGPDLRHPVFKKNIRQLLSELANDSTQQIMEYSCYD